MPRSALPLILAAAVLAAAPASASALDEQGYWAVADRLQANGSTATGTTQRRPLLGLQLGRALRRPAHARGRRAARPPRRRAQRPPRAPDRRCARRLAAVRRDRAAALEGRPDARARASCPRCTRSAPTSTSSSTARSSTASATRGSPGASWGSPTRSRDAIADRIHRTAMGSYWRWPTIRLNQINWYALVYAANATVTGSPRLLRHDLRLQIERFAARARGTRGRRRQPRRRAALQLPAAAARRRRADEHRLRRVREHHRLVHARVRAGPPGRHAAAVARPRGGCCASG